jgi:CheY-like chemotaxis protein
MATKHRLTRDAIIRVLVDALESLNYVHAFYEGGAAAFKRVDDWSDVDAYVVVDNDRVNDAFLAVEKVLESLSPIKQKYDVPQSGWLGIFQAFYKLEKASDFLIIDLAVLQLSCPDKLLEPEIHGNNVFYFNKNNVVKTPRLDKKAFAEKLQARLERLQARFDMFNGFVQKEINRGNSLEAIDLYHNLILGMLVEALRIKHNPVHYDFKMRYVHYELPPEVVEILVNLHFVKNMEDLQEKYREAKAWFLKTMSEIDGRQIVNLI